MPACYQQWLDRVPDLPGLSRAAPDVFPYLLQSTARGRNAGHSLLLCARGRALIARAGRRLEGPGQGGTFFERLNSWFRQEAVPGPADTGPDQPVPVFQGGWFLYLGYEMAAEVEPRLQLPAAGDGLPDALAQRCPGAVIVFHAGDSGAGDRALAVAESAELLEELLARVASLPSVNEPVSGRRLASIHEEDPVRFKASVRRIHQYLQAGDTFQVNISRRWSGQFHERPDPYGLYAALCCANPAPFAGLMRVGDRYVLSSSPERLVQVQGCKVQTRPIAGTRPRGSDTLRDRALSDELISNLKERAEHVMLIDLERNDLGRVCRPGTVEVNELMVVETYAHVHHIVSNVRGELVAGATPVDAIRAVFPGGTITGCPKVRCMEIIAELEREGRGFYTGSMGYLGRNGNMDLNILIRSMLLDGRRFAFRTGAGIVADSDPDLELRETADKARGMLLALESPGGERKRA